MEYLWDILLKGNEHMDKIISMINTFTTPDISNEEESYNISLNEYISKISELPMEDAEKSEEDQKDFLLKLFMVTQYYTNGSPWSFSRLQKIAECADTNKYVIKEVTEGEEKKEKLTFTETDPAYAGDHEGRMPGNWETRKEDWDCVQDILFE